MDFSTQISIKRLQVQLRYDRIQAEYKYCGDKHMFNGIENLKIENIYRGTSKNCTSVAFRKNNAFLFRTEGCLRFFFKDRIMDVPAGNIAFIPKGAAYDTLATESPSKFVSIVFSATLPDSTRPFTLPLEGFHETEELRNTLPDLWKFGNQAEHYKCYSFFYNLLSYLDSLKNHAHTSKPKENIILPAVSYLKKHLYDCDLSIDSLHELCGISGTYFRNLFRSRYGESPQKYILSKRLSYAKTIIESGDYDTINEVAFSVGYNDPLYFSRAFKKKYGLSPSRYTQ